MKKITLSLLAAGVLATTAATAQTDTSIGLKLPTQKGSVMLGSSLLLAETSFGSNNEDFTLRGSYNVSLHPRAAYFIADNLAIGGMLSANFSGNTFSNMGYHSQAVGLGIFARKYFGKATHKDGSMQRMRFFLEAGVAGNTGWSQFDISSSETQRSTFISAVFHVMPGFNYFLNRNVALEGGLNYSHTAVTGSAQTQTERIGINLGLQFFIGRK